MSDLIDNLHENLDELWKQDDFEKYPEERMTHFLGVITSAFARDIHRKLKAANVWTDNFMRTKENLTSAIHVCEQWQQLCKTLTGQFWKSYQLHLWRGDAFIPETLNQLKKRLKEAS